MRYTHIPNTTLKPSVICFGTGGLGSTIDRKSSFALLDRYVAHGGNLIDTALVYANWLPGEKSSSEKTIGRWLKQRGARDKVWIGTKGGHPRLGSMNISRLSPHEIVEDLEASLRHLETDVIDLYWLHRDDPKRPVGEILETLNEQVQSGKIRYFGCSNWRTPRIREAQGYAADHDIAGFCADQMQWSLARPDPTEITDPTMVTWNPSMHQYHIKTGLAAIPYSSQANGFFQKLDSTSLDRLPENLKKRYGTPENLKRYHRIKELSNETGLTVSQIVLAYLHSQPFPTIPIVGCRTLDQLTDSLSAADIRLDPTQLTRLQGNT